MEFTPPMNISKRDRSIKSVFLAGSIEMNTAHNWQREMSEFFGMQDINVFNPRRPSWDSSWKQEYGNPHFYQQVVWELKALESADIILMYFDPDTQAPVSLMELGLFAKSKKIHVVCPKPFWRKGNVDIVCDFYDVPMYSSLDNFKDFFIKNIK